MHFLEVVCKGRNMQADDLKPFADGRVFLPNVALEAGLIDEIGYWDAVMDRTAGLLDVDSVKVIRYEYPGSFMDILRGMRLGITPQGMLRQASPRFLYLWNPVL